MKDRHVSLARQIQTEEQVAAMPTEELERLAGVHEHECLKLKGLLGADSGHTDWARKARHSLRFLNAHASWIQKELAERKRAERHERNLEVQKLNAEKAASRRAMHADLSARRKQDDAARLARMRLANDENRRQIAVFKEVARDVLGAEMYEHIWQLAQQRISASTAN